MDDTSDSEVYRRWDDGFVVRRMRRDEEPQVIAWSGSLVTMSVDLQIVLDMRRDDDDGFYVGELNGEMIATLVETQVSVVHGSISVCAGHVVVSAPIPASF